MVLKGSQKAKPELVLAPPEEGTSNWKVESPQQLFFSYFRLNVFPVLDITLLSE